MTTFRRPQGKQAMRRTTYGKGDTPRYVDKQKFDDNFDRIFRKTWSHHCTIDGHTDLNKNTACPACGGTETMELKL